MQRVLVLDRNKRPLMPCNPARARKLLKARKAAVFRRFPFTIILKERENGETQAVALKIDPGSKTTGLALVADFKRDKRAIWAGNLIHRGQQIRDALLSRQQQRRSRRQRHTRYRVKRFSNRQRSEGWLPPSINSRLDNIWTWIMRLRRACPVTSLSQELVRFDTQLMQNAEISGVEYQQGELQGYEVREYLLEKWDRQCVYCGTRNVPMEVEHIVPKARGGTNRVSNLAIACHVCNELKGTQTADEFGYPEIQAKAKRPLKDTATVNITRWALFDRLGLTGLPIEIGTGGWTKFNRFRQGYPKTHWIDAACVGESGSSVYLDTSLKPLNIGAMGRQRRQMTLPDKYGFPRTKSKSSSQVHGFKTGDIVRAVVLNGKKVGTYTGRVAVRASGNFNITTSTRTVQGIPHRYCKALHRCDGYHY